MELSYQEVYRMNKSEARRHLVQTYQQTGSTAQTARLWQTSRQVVRRWVRRWQSEGQAGLSDRSRRPHSCPRQTKPAVEEQVLQLRRATGWGRQRLSRHEQELLNRAAQWLYYYNVERSHSGEGMKGQSPWHKLRQLGVKVPKEFAVLPRLCWIESLPTGSWALVTIS